MSRESREKYPQVYKRWKKKYYRNRNFKDTDERYRYSDYEDKLILERSITDTELAKKLNRSVQSIQIRRSRLKANITTKEQK